MARRNAPEKIEAILEAAKHLFSEKGYDNTPVAEIAERAGVAGGTVIYHFKSKDNLLFILARQILFKLFQKTHTAMLSAETAMQAVEAFVDAFEAFVKEEHREYLVFFRFDLFEILTTDYHPTADLRLVYSRYQGLLEEAMRRGVEEGAFTDIQPRQTAQMLFAMLNFAGRMHVLSQDGGGDLFGEVRRFARCRLV